jgi:hypothetical protein
VGFSLTGLVPSGPLGLHYLAEVGNGRASHLGAEAVQSVVDENNGKAINLALFARPNAVRGLQVGFSEYHDTLRPFRPRLKSEKTLSPLMQSCNGLHLSG